MILELHYKINKIYYLYMTINIYILTIDNLRTIIIYLYILKSNVSYNLFISVFVRDTTTGASSSTSINKFEKSHKNFVVKRSCKRLAQDFNRPSTLEFNSMLPNNIYKLRYMKLLFVTISHNISSDTYDNCTSKLCRNFI